MRTAREAKKKADRDLFLCKNWCFCLSLISTPNSPKQLIHRSQMPQLWQTGRWIQVLERTGQTSPSTYDLFSHCALGRGPCHRQCSALGDLSCSWISQAQILLHSPSLLLADTVQVPACPKCPLRKVGIAHWWGALSPSKPKPLPQCTDYHTPNEPTVFPGTLCHFFY